MEKLQVSRDIIDTSVKITICLRNWKVFTKEFDLFNAAEVIKQLDINVLNDGSTEPSQFLLDEKWIEI